MTLSGSELYFIRLSSDFLLSPSLSLRQWQAFPLPKDLETSCHEIREEEGKESAFIKDTGLHVQFAAYKSPLCVNMG